MNPKTAPLYSRHKYYNEVEAMLRFLHCIYVTEKLKMIFNNDLLMPVLYKEVFYNIPALKGYYTE
jgi:hypothetical protein